MTTVETIKKDTICSNGGCDVKLKSGRKCLVKNDLTFCKFCASVVLSIELDRINLIKKELKL